MKSAKLLLALAVALFVAWIGYLAYLVFTTEHPTFQRAKKPTIPAVPYEVAKKPGSVLSRPQLLASDFVVSLEVTDSEGTIQPGSIEVAWKKDAIKEGENLIKFVENAHLELSRCRDFNGSGRYLVPLQQPKIDELKVTRVPPSPGYSGSQVGQIYPDTPETRAQLGAMPTTEQKPGS